ncbi:MAG TPA: hypothetical protein VKA30_05705 [Actinomycetota bacterium]|nr:hypothetical protein [Actinomycetota bacterium]
MRDLRAPRAAFVSAVAMLFLAFGSPAVAQTTWHVMASPNRGSDFNDLFAVSARSTGDAWAVGSFRDANLRFRTLIEHYDGTAWRVVLSPNAGSSTNQLQAVDAISATDAWAVGQWFDGSANRTLALRWDGQRWRVVPTPNVGSGDNVLRGVVAISPTDVWAVGSERSEGTFAPLTEHWNGSSWSVVTAPVGLGGGLLRAVAAVSATDVWAVGALGDGDDGALAEHWNGSAWSMASMPAVFGEDSLASVTAVSSSDVWAVGHAGSRTLTEHWNGSAWNAVASPNPVPANANDFLNAVTAISSSDVWAVGAVLDFLAGSVQSTITMRWDGQAWTVVPSPNPGGGDDVMAGVDSPGGSAVVAVGHTRQTLGGPDRTFVIATNQG